MNRQTILFDLDDTLIHCNKYFDLVIDQFADQMEEWFHSYRVKKDEFKAKQLELDLAGVKIHGFAADRFPQSFVETYEYYCDLKGRDVSSEEIRQLLALGHTVYAMKIELYPDLFESLYSLQNESHQLILYTGGDEGIQMNKVKSAGLEKIFGDRIYIVMHKTTAAMENVLTVNGFDRRSTWMVGNSIRTDINPALEAGINAIFIPVSNEWAFNVVDLYKDGTGALYTVKALKDVPETIRAHTAKVSGYVR